MNLIEQYTRCFTTVEEPQTAFCPYRICPLGAHSDHQHGKVTGLAIDKGINIVYTPTDDGSVEMVSLNFDGGIQFNVNNVPEQKVCDWADYLRGATVALSKIRPLSRGIKGIIHGSLPIGGLSSSAAVIIAFITALCKVNGICLTADEIIKTAFWSEVNYVGVNVGTLDQSCEVLCQKDHLLYLDTSDGSYERIAKSSSMKPFKIAIFFSGIERSLAGSAFNTRVDELKTAAFSLMSFAGLECKSVADARLRYVPREVYDTYKDRLPENCRKRAEHYFTEYARVEAGADAWRNGDIETFGRLSFESGYSSIYNYETGSPELKELYEIMCRTKGIYGGRFSGAGFKGCCMALVDPNYLEEIEATVTKEYLKAFPHLEGKFSVHFCDSADGVMLR